MNIRLDHLKRPPALAVGLAAGLALVALFIAIRQAPEREDTAADARVLTVIEVQRLPFRVEAGGYGVARPAETWQAVANVPGRVVEKHPDLASGTLLRKGTALLKLDPARYELAIAEAQATLASLSAEQVLLEKDKTKTRRLLDLERERLNLAERELTRIERLAAAGSVSQSRHDEQRRTALTQRQAVASLESSLALIPSRARQLEAQIDQAAARLDQAHRDLEDTRFTAPYDLRLGRVNVEMHHYVRAGQTLFEADSLDAAEVEAHVPLSKLRRLMGGVARPDRAGEALDIGERLDLQAVRARVELVGADGIHWPGRVTRITSGLDPGTRAGRVVITVDHPYRNARPPDRPPLQRDMYLRVTLSADSPNPRLVVPAAAVHRGEIYRVNKDNRLERRPVEVAYEQNDLAVIAAGLAPGDRIIVDDVVPAIDGMPVAPRRDEALEQHLKTVAGGTPQ